MKVVICVDDSATAEKAFDWYFTSLHQLSNEVIAVNVGDQPKLPTFIFYEKSIFPMEEFQKEVEKCKAVMAELTNKYEQKKRTLKVACQVRSVAGDGSLPGETLCKFIQSENADMVVIGNRGMGTVRRTILGSVSDYVVHHSKVPVIVYR